MKYVLLELSKIMAPIMPFTADYIYKELSKEKESVHLEDWPKENKKLIDKDLEEKMEQVRQICSLALEKRAEAGLKVRQPLGGLQIPMPTGRQAKYKLQTELLDLIKDEVNVKEVILDEKVKEGVVLDTEITEELKQEGMVRDFIRSVQVKRKEMGLTPKDKIKVYYSENKEIVEKNKEQIKKQVIAEDVVFKADAPLTIDKV